MGNLLRPQSANRVILSDSARTQETFENMWGAMPDIDPVYAHDLYLGGLNDIASHCGQLGDDVESVLFLGHNPGFSEAAGWLSGTFIELKTAYIAVLEAENSDWSDLMRAGRWTLSAVPRDDGHARGQV